MAKTSAVQKNERRRRLAEKYADRRAELKKTISSSKTSEEEKDEARAKLAKLPRNSNPNRVRNRCTFTGPAARGVPPLRRLPHRDARARARGQDPRDAQGVLVIGGQRSLLEILGPSEGRCSRWGAAAFSSIRARGPRRESPEQAIALVHGAGRRARTAA